MLAGIPTLSALVPKNDKLSKYPSLLRQWFWATNEYSTSSFIRCDSEKNRFFTEFPLEHFNRKARGRKLSVLTMSWDHDKIVLQSEQP